MKDEYVFDRWMGGWVGGMIGRKTDEWLLD